MAPAADPRRPVLAQLAQQHRETGLRDARHHDYTLATSLRARQLIADAKLLQTVLLMMSP